MLKLKSGGIAGSLVFSKICHQIELLLLRETRETFVHTLRNLGTLRNYTGYSLHETTGDRFIEKLVHDTWVKDLASDTTRPTGPPP